MTKIPPCNDFESIRVKNLSLRETYLNFLLEIIKENLSEHFVFVCSERIVKFTTFRNDISNGSHHWK